MEPIIGILGGMGPWATLDFYGKLLKLSNGEKDQDNPHVIIDCNTKVPDRTSYILGRGENPLPALIQSAKTLTNDGASIVAMPCNTAHYFYDDIIIELDGTDVSFINMIDETALQVRKINKERVMLLATKGTYSTGIYQAAFEKHGLTAVIPQEAVQDLVMRLIYELKGGRTSFDRNDLLPVLKEAELLDVQGIVIGCTEIPIIFRLANISVQAIDATEILAEAVMRKFNESIIG